MGTLFLRPARCEVIRSTCVQIVSDHWTVYLAQRLLNVLPLLPAACAAGCDSLLPPRGDVLKERCVPHVALTSMAVAACVVRPNLVFLLRLHPRLQGLDLSAAAHGWLSNWTPPALPATTRTSSSDSPLALRRLA
jgi:hypothetical protein